jgi:hypothetical protein
MTCPKKSSFPESWTYFILLGFILVLVFTYTFPRVLSGSLWPDEALYAWLADTFSLQVAFSKEFIERQPPLFPFILSAGHFIQPFSEIVLRGICVILGLLGVMAGFYAGRLIGGSHFIAGVCAFGIGFSPSYIGYMPRILSDATMMTSFIFFVIALSRAMETPAVGRHCLVGILGVLLVLLKWSGVLCVPMLFIVYAFNRDPLIRSRAFIPLGMLFVVLCGLFYNNFLQLERALPNITALKGVIFTGPPWFYITHSRFIFPFPGAPYLVLLGFIIMWLSRHPQRVLISAWFLLTFLSVSMAGEKDIRYSFLFLPPAVMLTGILFDRVINLLSKKGSFQVLFKSVLSFFVILLFASRLNPGVTPSEYSYLGFREAGEYIRGLKASSMILLADSDRAIRFYSRSQFKEFGGNLSVLPQSFEQLKDIISSAPGKIVLVIDRWEYTQPGWAYPLTREKLQNIKEAGFRLVSVVRKPEYDPTLRGRSRYKVPAVWIFSGQGKGGASLSQEWKGQK